MSKTKVTTIKNCKTCKHWKNQQSELDYSKFNGICTCPIWKFNSSRDGDIKLLDRENRSDKFMGVQRFENQSEVVPIGSVERSRYVFVTDEKFGCIHHSA